MRVKLLTAAALGAALLVAPETSARAFDGGQSGRSGDDWCANVGESRDRETYCEVRQLSLPAPATLEVSTTNGSIAIEGTSRRDVMVEVRVVAQAETRGEAQAIAGQVSVRPSGGRLAADGPKTDYARSWWVSYRIDAPRQQNVRAEAANGSVALANLSGRIAAETQNGSLRLSDLEGNVTARTANGSLQVALGGSTWRGEGLEATTSNGSLRVLLPETYNARLIASTNNGGMRVSRPVTVQGRIGKELDTVLGNGGPTVRLRTSNGSLTIGER